MNTTMRRSRLNTLALALAVAVSAVACSGSGDKAGGPGERVMLRMANPYGDIGQLPAVETFVERVEKLSGALIDIELVDQYGEFEPDAEEQVVRDVAAGAIDLGWVGTRVFDTMGVNDFKALTAPMLIDSYALQDAVIKEGITTKMLDGLEAVGVKGLAVLADGLRKPIGVAGPILGPDDWMGIGFGTYKSEAQGDAIGALDAVPHVAVGPNRDKAIKDGTISGFEMGLFIYQRDPRWARLAPYVTANVNLWPQMDVILINPGRLEELSAETRGWLEQAAREVANESAAIADTEERSVAGACQTGARFAEAEPADVAALRDAFAPAIAELERDPVTKAVVDQILALKASSAPEPAPSIPADCTGAAPASSAAPRGEAPPYLNGTYRYEITLEEATAADMVDAEDTYPLLTDVTLADGQLAGGCFGDEGGTYWVENDRLTFHSISYGADIAATFTRRDDGSLVLTPFPPVDPGDAFQCFSQVWTKIE